MLPFPNIDPEIFSINLFGFQLSLRWYALSYIAGFFVALVLMKYFPSRRLWTCHVVPIAKSQRQAGLANNLHITTTTLATTAKKAPSTSRSLPAMTSLSIGSQGTNVLVGTRECIPKDLTALCS